MAVTITLALGANFAIGDHTVTDRSGTEQNNNIDTEVIVPQTTAVPDLSVTV